MKYLFSILHTYGKTYGKLHILLKIITVQWESFWRCARKTYLWDVKMLKIHMNFKNICRQSPYLLMWLRYFLTSLILFDPSFSFTTFRKFTGTGFLNNPLVVCCFSTDALMTLFISGQLTKQDYTLRHNYYLQSGAG